MFYKDKKIVVTGGSGFVGTHFIQELLNRGASVITHTHKNPLKIHDKRITWLENIDLEKLDANSVEEGGKLVQGLLTDKVLASATGGVVPTYGPKMKRFGRARTMLDTYFGTRYGKRLSATNPDNLLVNYTKFLKLIDPTGKNIDRNARLSKLIKELDAL